MAKKIFKPEDLSADVQELFKVLNCEENDIAVVLIATSFLDSCLKTLLKEKFIDGETSKQLLERTLESFSTKCMLCYSLGLIPKDMFKDLTLISEIRNQMAHHHLQLSFNDSDIIEKCKQLDACKKSISLFEQRNTTVDTRDMFTITVSIISNCIIVKALGEKLKNS